ncbi:MAG: hypothetical protein EAZ30_14495 [Betaproteobacteria bacterium]|nr:MAG: hypothetical protein EAZ30_14495 [Betaproteobacteria bacterium]
MKILLVHDEMINESLPVFAQYPDLQRVFVFDPAFIAAEGWTMKRVQFIADGLMEIPNIHVYKGALTDVCSSLSVSHIVTQRTPNHCISAWLAGLTPMLIDYVDESPFVRYSGRVTRFTKYWKTVEPQWFPKAQ